MTFYSLEDAQREMPIGYEKKCAITIAETRFAKDNVELELLKKVYDSVVPKPPSSTYPSYFTCTKKVEMPEYKVDGYIYDGVAWYPVQKEENYNYEVFCWKPIKEEND